MMAIPVYIWLNDDDGSSVKGNVDIKHREGSIEMLVRTNSTSMVSIRLMLTIHAGRDL